MQQPYRLSRHEAQRSPAVARAGSSAGKPQAPKPSMEGIWIAPTPELTASSVNRESPGKGLGGCKVGNFLAPPKDGSTASTKDNQRASRRQPTPSQLPLTSPLHPLPPSGGKSNRAIKSKKLFSTGITAKTAPFDLRERLAIPDAERPRAIEELASYPHIEEAAILTTCNRLEIYAVTTDFNKGERAARGCGCRGAGLPFARSGASGGSRQGQRGSALRAPSPRNPFKAGLPSAPE